MIYNLFKHNYKLAGTINVDWAWTEDNKYFYVKAATSGPHLPETKLQKQVMKVRAKFTLTAIKNEDGSMSINGSAVCDGSEENKAFNDASPGGNFYLHIAADKTAQDNFQVGVSKEYYLDITEAVASAPEVDATTVIE